MKKLLILLSLFPICATAAPKKRLPPLPPTTAVVEYIFDGDTFRATVLMPDDIKIDARVRIIDIDAPEMSGACDAEIEMANHARDRLAELLPIGSTVTLTKIKDDKYLGRIDAAVFANGKNISNILISENLVRKYGGEKRAGWCD